MTFAAKRRLLASGEVLDDDDEEPAKVRPPPPMPTAKMGLDPAAPVVVQAPRTDKQILDAIVSKAERLTDKERGSFKNMQKAMADGRIVALSFAQRAWAQEAAARLGFDVETPEDWRDTATKLRG